jgi:hypothetical protein
LCNSCSSTILAEIFFFHSLKGYVKISCIGRCLETITAANFMTQEVYRHTNPHLQDTGSIFVSNQGSNKKKKVIPAKYFRTCNTKKCGHLNFPLANISARH